MRASDLIGKRVIRKKETEGMRGKSLITKPIKILYVSANHIVCENPDNKSTSPIILGNDFNDNEWVDYDELISKVYPKEVTSLTKEDEVIALGKLLRQLEGAKRILFIKFLNGSAELYSMEEATYRYHGKEIQFSKLINTWGRSWAYPNLEVLVDDIRTEKLVRKQ